VEVATEVWDTIVVGAGSAGCAIAARLSAEASRRVLLLEAGPSDRHLMLRVPSGNFQIIGDRRFDWCLWTEPEPNMANRRLQWPRGKVLGGSSAINGLVAIRGHRDDYDGWNAMGCEGWGWNDVLPHFLRLEDFEPGASELHNVGGPLPLSIARGRHFLCEKYADAGAEVLGLSRNDDFNGRSQEGSGYHHVNVSRGLIPVRVSAATAYLKEARRRANLKIVTGATALRIDFDGRRAKGIVYAQGQTTYSATARRQVILCAGTVFSPHLLQLSGIGAPDHLRSLGIKVVEARSGVGENLQDHLQTLSVYRVNVPTVNDKVRHILSKLATAFEGMIMRTGPYYGVTNFGMFVRTERNLTRPDTQFHIHPASGSFKTPDRFSGLTVSAYKLRPESRGRIVPLSADARVMPAIYANYLSAPSDQQVAVATLRISRKLSESRAIEPFIDEERKPGSQLQTDDELLDYARQTGETTYHPVGTCRMGGDDASVVDPRLRVRGLAGLYVADASIMPTLISGNTHLPSVMIGEKAAEIVRDDERRRPIIAIRSDSAPSPASVTADVQSRRDAEALRD
jgi:choline dehydrogenase